MKKILFLLLFGLAMFSSLYALPVDSSVSYIEKSQAAPFDGAACNVPSVAIATVYIWHKDTIHYSLDLGTDYKIPGIGGGYKQNINANLNRIAVVSHARFVSGC